MLNLYLDTRDRLHFIFSVPLAKNTGTSELFNALANVIIARNYKSHVGRHGKQNFVETELLGTRYLSTSQV